MKKMLFINFVGIIKLKTDKTKEHEREWNEEFKTRTNAVQIDANA